MGVLAPADRSLFGDDAMTTHYTKRKSTIKRKRLMGFRSRMKTKSGRKIINNKRRRGQMLNAAER